MNTHRQNSPAAHEPGSGPLEAPWEKVSDDALFPLRTPSAGLPAVAAALGPGGDPGVKRFFSGTHRLLPPGETLARLRPLMTAMGITRVANISGLDCIGIPVALSFRPNSRALAVSQGKGLELEEAKAGALMESIESFHAERVAVPLKFGSYDDLRPAHRLVDVDRLPLARDTAFHPGLPLLWVEGYDLLQRERVWLPYELVSTNFTLPFPPGFGCFQANSNGLAAGNHLLEAVSHALCEVVERDALALWECLSLEAKRERRVDLASIDDPGCRQVLADYERTGIEIAVWEMTTDTGLPSFHCSIAERATQPTHFFYSAPGAGCHPCRAIALSRALTEAAQVRLTFIAGSRDNVFREDYHRARNQQSLDLRRRQWRDEVPVRNFRDAPDRPAPTLRDDVLWELERLHAIGVERVIVVDLTRPDLGIPVVRVVVPGLEGVPGTRDYAAGARARAMLADRS